MSQEAPSSAVAGLRFSVRGSVQGVGFRPWLWRSARSLGLRGSVRNVAGGVSAEVFGPAQALASFGALLEDPPLPGVVVEAVEMVATGAPAPAGFEIVESGSVESGSLAGIGLAPELPTCAACLDELGDPGSRRHRYPFIACAGCGPRYTMARGLPYDRARTAMADFPLCAECAAEYLEPEDRRFHAEATACPACGPSLRCLSPDGEVIGEGEAAFGHAIAVLHEGGTVAVHGIGGFHLACDACDEAAVRAAELYARNCALCHGERGDGQGLRQASLFRRPRDFRDPVWREGRTAAQVRAAIRDGIPGTDMPSWRRLDDAEIAALADHVLAFGAGRP